MKEVQHLLSLDVFSGSRIALGERVERPTRVLVHYHTGWEVRRPVHFQVRDQIWDELEE